MGETVQITEAIHKMNGLFEGLKSKIETAESRLETENKTLYEALGLEMDGQEKFNLKAMADDIREIAADVDKLRRRKAAAEVPEEMPLTDDPKVKAIWQASSTRSYRESLNRILRKGHDGQPAAKPDLNVLTFNDIPEGIEVADHVKSALTTDFDPGLGFFVPPTFEQEITRAAVEMTPFEQQCTTKPCGTNRYVGYVRSKNRDTVEAGRETEARPAKTQLKRYQEKAIDVYEFHADPGLSRTMLEDSSFDVLADVRDDVTLDFAVQRNRVMLKGTGNEEPEGLMVAAGVPVMKSGLAGGFKPENIRALPQQIPAEYKVGASYGISREALTELMIQRDRSGGTDETGQFLWQPALQDGTPSRINGSPYWEATELDAVAANAFPIVYGNFKRACRVARRRGLRVLRDELTEYPVIVIKMSERWGFRVWLEEAVVKLRIAA